MTRTVTPLKRLPQAPNAALEQQFLDYLLEHPDFFARHDDALSRIALRHGSGTAASLLERHTARLRDRVGQLEHQLEDLVDIARDNETNARHMHTLAQALLQAPSRAAALHILAESMARDFDIEATRIVMLSNEETGLQQCLAFQGRLPRQLADVVRTGITRCGPITAELRSEVFPDQPALRSCAIVPLDRHARDAALILASGSSTQFEEGMGTFFLDMTAGLLAAVLAADDGRLGAD